MINSVYGKIMENLRKRINARLVNNETDFLNYISRPTHITQRSFDKNDAAIHGIKPILTHNRPIYAGCTVLELNKWLMYDFHYNFIKKHFEAELLFTDTDSLTYEIKSEAVYEEFFKHKHLFDSKFYDSQNEMVIGKMKAVNKGIPINKFVGLKSKMYFMFSNDGEESNMAKGVNITTEFNEFKDAFFKNKIMRHKMKKIQRKNANLKHMKSTKISLSCFDDKRFVLNDEIQTLAYFHRELKK